MIRFSHPRRHGALVALALCAASGAWAAAPDPAGEYRACLTKAERDPAAAFELASAWSLQGGGPPARHCAAAALLRLNRPKEAAERFDGLAKEQLSLDRKMAAELLGQAAAAWSAAKEPSRARAALDQALGLKPGDPDLLIDRALGAAAAGDVWAALDDLNTALEKAPRRADALVLRAAAWRRLGKPDLARDDAERALKLKPRDVDALAERAAARAALGDRAGARADYLAVITQDEKSLAADLARAGLERLEGDGAAKPR